MGTPGCAHGFFVLTESADFLYKCTDYYHPESELSLAWDDPTIGVQWPIPKAPHPACQSRTRLAYRGKTARCTPGWT